MATSNVYRPYILRMEYGVNPEKIHCPSLSRASCAMEDANEVLATSAGLKTWYAPPDENEWNGMKKS